jgi:hypothetical protein
MGVHGLSHDGCDSREEGELVYTMVEQLKTLFRWLQVVRGEIALTGGFEYSMRCAGTVEVELDGVLKRAAVVGAGCRQVYGLDGTNQCSSHTTKS